MRGKIDKEKEKLIGEIDLIGIKVMNLKSRLPENLKNAVKKTHTSLKALALKVERFDS
ncbi:MAG: hypothetical protein ACOWYE_12290 [Desulfatiglandales bacterium]